MSSHFKASPPHAPAAESVLTRLGSFLSLTLAGTIDGRRRDVALAIRSHPRVGSNLWDEEGGWPGDYWALGRRLRQILEEDFLVARGVRETCPGTYRLPARLALPGTKATKVFFKTEPALRGQHVRTTEETILAFHVHEFWPEMRRCSDAIPPATALPAVAERIFYRLELFAQAQVEAEDAARAGVEKMTSAGPERRGELAARCRGLAARLHFSGAGPAAGPLAEAAASAFLTPDDRAYGHARSSAQTHFTEACRQVSSALRSLECHARRPIDAGPNRQGRPHAKKVLYR